MTAAAEDDGRVDVVGAVGAHLRRALGPAEPVSASVTFLGVEPLEVLRFAPDADRVVRYATAGCARYAMGEPDQLVTDPVRGPRAELVVSLRGGVDGVLRSLALLAATPAVEGLVLQPDALLDLGTPLWEGSAFTAVLLGVSPEVEPLVLGEPYEDVQFLEVVPVTGTEAAWVRLRGAPALRTAWTEAGIDVRDPGRSAVLL